MGDPVNVAARLASVAGPDEVLITLEAAEAADLDLSGLERRELELRGKSTHIGRRASRPEYVGAIFPTRAKTHTAKAAARLRRAVGLALACRGVVGRRRAGQLGLRAGGCRFELSPQLRVPQWR